MKNVLDIYTEVWVAITYGDTEIYKIYLIKEDAEKEAIENNASAKKLIFYDPKLPKCEVKSFSKNLSSILDRVTKAPSL